VTMLTRLADPTKRLTSARDAIAQLRHADRTLTAEHAHLLQERTDLLRYRPPRAEIVAELEFQIDAVAATYATEHGARLVAAVSAKVETEPGRDTVTGIRRGNLPAAFPGPLSFIDLCALAPEIVKASLAKIVQAVEYEAGPPMSTRLERIAEIDTRLADVERAHTDLVDEAREAGVSLPLMPDERARRIQAAQRVEAARRFNEANRDAIRRGAVAPMPEEVS
jgi:hypothetical protein